jgi:hypothetical protein
MAWAVMVLGARLVMVMFVSLAAKIAHDAKTSTNIRHALARWPQMQVQGDFGLRKSGIVAWCGSLRRPAMKLTRQQVNAAQQAFGALRQHMEDNPRQGIPREAVAPILETLRLLLDHASETAE